MTYIKILKIFNSILLIIQRLNRNLLISSKGMNTLGLKPKGTNTSIIYDKNHKINTDNPIYAYIVGLFEGDGWIGVYKKGKYLSYEVGLEISIKDIQLIHKVKNILGVGKIITRLRKLKNGLDNEIVIYKIKNKDHLKNIIIPIFDKYSILTNKQYDYLFFKNNLLNNIQYYNELLLYTRPLKPINNVNDILNKDYLPYWLIGFIEAEGCFSFINPTPASARVPIPSESGGTNKKYKVANFEISQTNALEVIEAIRIYLIVSQNIYLNKDNHSRIALRKIIDIYNIIIFIKKNPIKLLGYKRLQYILFLKELRLINKYLKYINIPDKY